MMGTPANFPFKVDPGSSMGLSIGFAYALSYQASMNLSVQLSYAFGNKYTIHFTLKAIISKLPMKMFARVHRSYIVNLAKIEMIEDKAIIMKVKGETKSIPIAKSYKDDLMNNINIMSK